MRHFLNLSVGFFLEISSSELTIEEKVSEHTEHETPCFGVALAWGNADPAGEPTFSCTIRECNVCGEAHDTSSCPLLVQKVDDKSVPSRARLSLPPNLSLGEAPDGSPRVVAREDVPVGTQFGPVEAPRYRQFKGEPRFRLKVSLQPLY